MDSINKIVEKRLNHHKLGESAKSAMILHFANQLLQDMLKTDETQVKAMRLKEGVLTIQALSSVWSQELWGCKEKLTGEIHKKFDSKALHKIIIQTGAMED